MASIAYGILYDYEQAQEMSIIACAKLFSSKIKYNGEEHLSNYVFKIIRSTCFNYYRHKKNTKKIFKPLDDTYDNEAIEHEERKYTDEQIEILNNMVAELPARCKEVILCYLKGFSSKQTAKKLGITVANVDVQKYKGVQLLRKKIFNK